MNTWFELILLGEDEEHLSAVGEAALDEVVRVEQLLSRFDASSEVSRLNRLAAQQPQLVGFELLAFLQHCREAWQQTAGYFDPTAVSQSRSPEHKFDFSAVEIDPVMRLVVFSDPRLFLDFGAVGKGYALDRAAQGIREFGIQHALLHGGTSSVLAIGTDENGNEWPIGIRDPFGTGGEVATLSLSDRSLSSSAVFGERQNSSDLVNPVTGVSLTEQRACVVLTKSATTAEILSTACLCLGPETARQKLQGVSQDFDLGWIEAGGVKWLPAAS